MKSWKLEPLSDRRQTEEEDTFLGGRPKLPPDVLLPSCGICGKELAFFFQVAFPQGHKWEGKSMAVFYCVEEWHDRYCIPELPDGPSLNKVDVTADFLNQYQRNFRVLVFDTAKAVPVEGYQEKVAFRSMAITQEDKTDRGWDMVIGGRPVWIMGQAERPASVAGDKKPVLLLQVREDLKFPILPDAPREAAPFFSHQGIAFSLVQPFCQGPDLLLGRTGSGGGEGLHLGAEMSDTFPGIFLDF